MNTRTIVEAELFVLRLNPVTDVMEANTIVAIGTNPDDVMAWVESQKAPERYESGRFGLIFKEDSPIKMYNECLSYEPNSYGHGITREWLQLESVNNFLTQAQNSYGFTHEPTIVGE